MATAKTGDQVRVHYTGRLEDGTVFDSSRGREPLAFTVGQGQVIPGFENAVVGMKVGDTRTTSIPPDEAYGHYREDMVAQIDRAQVPPELEIEVGQQLQVEQQDGEVIPVTVMDVTDDTVTLDANHPLAGETLVFDIELMKID
jgi:peptidylprolyl isomerase